MASKSSTTGATTNIANYISCFDVAEFTSRLGASGAISGNNIEHSIIKQFGFTLLFAQRVFA